METWQLKQRQSHPLDIKEQLSKNRIRSWYEYFEGNVYVAFSGGKDSTVLLHLVRSIYPNVPAVFCDTGLEYPEIREFVKTIENVVWLKPKMLFKEVIETYGYPVISKEVALKVRQLRTLPKGSKSYVLRETGVDSKGNMTTMGKVPEKWKFLRNAPFKISEKCCDIFKKNPFKEYEKQTKRKPMIGTMAYESRNRKMQYLKYGCNSFREKGAKSQPMSFWLEDDIWGYIKKYNVTYSKIYDMGLKRTGCMFCMFGVHLEESPNRFEIMKETHPKIYKYCMENLRLKEVLSYIFKPLIK